MVPTLEFEGQLLVVNSETMQDRRVEIVDMSRVLHDVITVIVGFSVGRTWLDASPRHPHGETAGMMVAPLVIGG